MDGAFQGRGCAERLRSRDKIDEDESCSDDMRIYAGEEKKKKCSYDMKKNVRKDAGKEMSNCGKKKNRTAGSDDAEQRKKKKILNGDNKPKSRKVCTPFFEKARKKMLSTISQNGPMKKKSNDISDKKKTVPLSVNKNKVRKGEMSNRTSPNTPVAKERKIQHSDSMEMKKKKRDASFVHPGKRTSQIFNTNNKEMKGEMSNRTSPNTPVVKERKIQHSDSMEMKKKKRDASFVHSGKRTSQIFNTNNKEMKRKVPSTPLRREQKMQEGRSNDKKEAKKARIIAEGNEKKTCSDQKKKKRKAPFAFFKFMCNKFKELLFIPPAVTPSFEDLNNHHVYLEDSEGKSSKIRRIDIFCAGVWSGFL
uniref:Uncharacterized protein n=1 Tax=Leersia perrieri TaxID=77586 RepID=A0A0D9VHV6_9ORYZ